MWAGKARTRSTVLLAVPKCWVFSAVRPWAPAPAARQGSNTQECWLSFPVGWVWRCCSPACFGGRQPGGFAPTSIWLQPSCDKLLCDTCTQGSCCSLPQDMGSGTPLPRAQWLPGHIPSGHGIPALNAKKAPTPNPRYLHRPHSAYLLPKRTRKPWGPGQLSPPHWEQGCAVAPRTMGNCPGTATPVLPHAKSKQGTKAAL